MDQYADGSGQIDYTPYQQAIKDIESSGGDYSALGPVTSSGDRAYGAYQVMGNNIPDWTAKHFGQRLTPQEFLKNKAAQDAVFNGEFGSYLQKHGNPQDAASIWFSGRPLAKVGNSSDGYMTVPSYVSKFTSGLNKYMGGAPSPSGAGALAFAGNGGEDGGDTGALSASNALGPGALQTLIPDAQDDTQSKWGKKLMNIGAALSSITSPQQAYALNSMAAQMSKDGKTSYQTRIGKDGSLYRISSDGGVQVYRPGAQQQAAANNVPQIGDWNKSGDEYLASIPDTQRAIVQQLVNGQLPLSQYKLNDPNILALAAAAHHYDPTFNPAMYQARAAGMKDWVEGGKSADIVKSLNQSIGHLSELPQKFDALHNGQSPMLNSIGNAWNNQVMGKTGVTGFIPAAHAVADEMGKLFKGANLSDREIKQWSEALNENMSPDQMKDSIKTLRGLMQHSMQALEQKRLTAVGDVNASKFGPLLSAEASAALDALDKWAQPNQSKSSAMPKGVNSIKVIQP
ncbi:MULTISPECIES: hypothetical protein [unclassified Bradyrhizobium]|uniref:hypothetical protein n=1 Tax=unclassified Bradyrhizobium TaxID=2631580 RepID=UPI0029162662|nr:MULTISPECIES: hypothetical protein [unclassified Bradyrhizobium]